MYVCGVCRGFLSAVRVVPPWAGRDILYGGGGLGILIGGGVAALQSTSITLSHITATGNDAGVWGRGEAYGGVMCAWLRGCLVE